MYVSIYLQYEVLWCYFWLSLIIMLLVSSSTLLSKKKFHHLHSLFQHAAGLLRRLVREIERRVSKQADEIKTVKFYERCSYYSQNCGQVCLY